MGGADACSGRAWYIRVAVIVVIPTAREIDLESLTSLIDWGARFVIVDDSDGRIDIRHPQVEVYNWTDQERILGDLLPAIPRRNGACRDFGFYIAWRDAEDEEIVVALDDDCVTASGFAEAVDSALQGGRYPVAGGSGHHFNVLDLYTSDCSGLFPRGFPYSKRVGYEPWQLGEARGVTPLFNLGLWQGSFDVNGVDKIQRDDWNQPEAELKTANVVVPPGALISVCSMNMHMRAGCIPAVYQWPMHVPVTGEWVIDRYGDIWGGFLLKSLMDRRGDVMTVGSPMIRHDRHASYLRSIWQEHVAHLVNDEVIDAIFRFSEEVDPGSYLDMVGAFAEKLPTMASNATPLIRSYLDHLATALGCWVQALEMARSRTRPSK